MDSAGILPHVVSIAHGLGASLVCALVLYLAGLVVLPNRWNLVRGEFPGLLGAALWVTVCWFGIAGGMPVPRLALGYVGVAVALAAVRHRWVAASLRAVATRNTLGWIGAFAALYVLAYLFTMPPATGDFLPPAWSGNIDLLTYIRHTQYVLLLGPSNLAGYSYLNYVYFQTPGVFHLLGGLSLLFDLDPIRAAMPAQFAFTALIGVFVVRISRDVFELPRASAFVVAGILVSGPFFRYIAGNYFLSTLMSTPVVLYLLWTTVSYRPTKLLDVGLMFRLGCAYLLLLLIYPFLLAVGLGMQMATTALRALSGIRAPADGDGEVVFSWREAARHVGRVACASLPPLVLLIGAFFEHVKWSGEMVFALTEKDINGWPLGFISPWVIWGFPGSTAGLEVGSPDRHIWAMATFGAMALTLVGLFYGVFRKRTSPAARTLAGVAAGSFIAYCVYFSRIGPSYQQWKFASYTVLPLSFVIFAGGLHLLGQSAPFRRLTLTTLGNRLIVGVLMVVFIGGNVLVHARRDPDLRRYPGEIRQAAEIDRLSTFRDISIWAEDPAELTAWFVLYYLPSKRVHLLGGNYDLDQWLFEEVSAQRPMLIPTGCEGIGHIDVVPVREVGCLLFTPPSLPLDTGHPFSRTFPFINVEGMSQREDDGRWNNRPSVRLKLTTDPRRTELDRNLYINVLVHPFLPPGVERQRLMLTWGNQWRAETALDDSEWNTWISLPVRGSDWSGNWVWSLPIEIDLPDAKAGVIVGPPDAPHLEDRPLAVMFQELSMTSTPKGRLIEGTKD